MLNILLLSISLSLDALTVSFAYGTKNTAIPHKSKIIVSICSMIYFGISIWFGEFISNFFPTDFSVIIGIILMGLICFYMIYSIFKKSKPNDEVQMPKTLLDLTLKSMGLSIKVMKNPMLCDMDGSKTISAGEAIFLGTALSVDSISVGIGYALTGSVSLYAPFVVGLCQLAFLAAGNFLGRKFLTKNIKHQEKLQIVSVAAMLGLLIIRIISVF